jgi:mono/diheme cytochrome c family protein
MAFRRWIGRILVGLVVIAALAATAIYFRSESLIYGNDAWRTRDFAPPPPGDAAVGKRLGVVYGCPSCHGEQMGGANFVDEPWLLSIPAANVSERIAQYDDVAFVRLIRTGVKADGGMALGMPTKAFQRMGDADVGHLLAWLRTLAPVSNPDLGTTTIHLPVRFSIVTGDFPMDEVHADEVEGESVLADRHHPDATRRLMQVACGECHGTHLGGFEGDTPSLEIIKAYSLEQLTTLLRTGVTIAGTESASGLMSAVARERFQALTDEEIAAIKAYADRN